MKELSLLDLKRGQQAVIERVATADRQMLEKVAALGFYPGMVITVHMKHPQFVVSVGKTLVGMDRELAESIRINAPNLG